MVAYYDECNAAEHPQTLTDWVRNFRLKRQKMRRKLRGAGSDLRVNAILSTALFHAEHELRRKQQERFSRWLEMQTRFVPHGRTHCGSDVSSGTTDARAKVEAQEQREIEDSLWRSELSGLDTFMRSLSSSNNNGNNGKLSNGNSQLGTSNTNNASNSYTANTNSCTAIAVFS
ncbi:hypothetical protein KR018_012336 [Drosophila ironensis]|nr:hypothetical protein KR018_012336 [Drosophila ironensis]